MALAVPSLLAFRDATRLASVGDWLPFCSNFFFISFTLARTAPGTALPVADRILVPSLPVDLSSTGLEADRYMGLWAVRLPGGAGSLELVPLLVARKEEGG